MVVTAPAIIEWAQLTPRGVEVAILSGGRSFVVRVPSRAWRVRAALETWVDQDQPLTVHREHFQRALSRALVVLRYRPGRPLLVWLRRLP